MSSSESRSRWTRSMSRSWVSKLTGSRPISIMNSSRLRSGASAFMRRAYPCPSGAKRRVATRNAAQVVDAKHRAGSGRSVSRRLFRWWDRWKYAQRHRRTYAQRPEAPATMLAAPRPAPCALRPLSRPSTASPVQQQDGRRQILRRDRAGASASAVAAAAPRSAAGGARERPVAQVAGDGLTDVLRPALGAALLLLADRDAGHDLKAMAAVAADEVEVRHQRAPTSSGTCENTRQT